ncbi:hypothetical protein KOR34_52510 [Posidoniimonas corsicana]|uniref:PEP-CTERM protein-sorting domain-containing protein n=1 Tax=Posidoniimonas corsicana TaxID=1938618 RepID=A0A5C5US97_9BACT|nr:LamG domain-containing protein [Posidoniimonas corsicana]TWT29341.1 hypothetical protein KOR34_52510 [Posidoniimonas corsicana]
MKTRPILNRGLALSAVAACVALAAGPMAATADTVAYWRFEDGPVDTDIIHNDPGAGVYSADIEDVSGNGNDLSVWETGGGAGYVYRSQVPVSTIEATGAANNFSVQNTGGGPAMFTGPTAIQTIAPSAFTIEASFKLENGGFRTVVGRDSTGVVNDNADLAAVYFQAVPGNGFAIKFADQDGFFHAAEAPGGTLDTWDPGTETDADAVWYHAAGVSDGSTLSLYLANASAGTGYQLVAQTDLTASGSTNTALTPGAGDGGDWNTGDWSVGRGLYAGGHVDRAYGFIDEVRISDHAVGVSDLLHFGASSSLTLEVNTSSGAVTIRNNTANAISMDYYEIGSDSGALAPGSWNSLEDQGVGGSLQGDFNEDGSVDAADYTVWRDGLGGEFGPEDYDVWRDNYGQTGGGGGGAWTEAGGSDAELLSELLLEGSGTVIAPGGSLSLGTAFNTAGANDLTFNYGQPGSGLFIGGVSYVSSAGASSAPEPFALGLVATAGLAAFARRRR